jgi:hypothetical protein
MLVPLATAWWIAPAVTVLLLALPAFVIWRLDRRDARAARRVSWDEFERQFAQYVEESSYPDGPERFRR